MQLIMVSRADNVGICATLCFEGKREEMSFCLYFFYIGSLVFVIHEQEKQYWF
jgi:hypothetical protein